MSHVSTSPTRSLSLVTIYIITTLMAATASKHGFCSKQAGLKSQASYHTWHTIAVDMDISAAVENLKTRIDHGTAAIKEVTSLINMNVDTDVKDMDPAANTMIWKYHFTRVMSNANQITAKCASKGGDVPTLENEMDYEHISQIARHYDVKKVLLDARFPYNWTRATSPKGYHYMDVEEPGSILEGDVKTVNASDTKFPLILEIMDNRDAKALLYGAKSADYLNGKQKYHTLCRHEKPLIERPGPHRNTLLQILTELAFELKVYVDYLNSMLKLTGTGSAKSNNESSKSLPVCHRLAPQSANMELWIRRLRDSDYTLSANERIYLDLAMIRDEVKGINKFVSVGDGFRITHKDIQHSKIEGLKGVVDVTGPIFIKFRSASASRASMLLKFPHKRTSSVFSIHGFLTDRLMTIADRYLWINQGNGEIFTSMLPMSYRGCEKIDGSNYCNLLNAPGQVDYACGKSLVDNSFETNCRMTTPTENVFMLTHLPCRISRNGTQGKPETFMTSDIIVSKYPTTVVFDCQSGGKSKHVLPAGNSPYPSQDLADCTLHADGKLILSRKLSSDEITLPRKVHAPRGFIQGGNQAVKTPFGSVSKYSITVTVSIIIGLGILTLLGTLFGIWKKFRSRTKEYLCCCFQPGGWSRWRRNLQFLSAPGEGASREMEPMCKKEEPKCGPSVRPKDTCAIPPKEQCDALPGYTIKDHLKTVPDEIALLEKLQKRHEMRRVAYLEALEADRKLIPSSRMLPPNIPILPPQGNSLEPYKNAF